MLSILTITVFSGLVLSSEPEPTRSVMLVSFLTEQATPICIDGGKTVWVEPRFELGFTPVAASAVPLSPLVNKAVIATGIPNRTALSRRDSTGNQGPCYVAQMRSDWVAGRDGMRVRRNGSSRMHTFDISELRLYEGLSVAVNNERVTVRISSPVAGSYQVRAAIHYEGCMGKPGALAEGREVTISDTTATSVSFPTRKKESSGAYHAAALTLSGGDDRLQFDLNVPLRFLLSTPAPACP